MKFVVSSLQLSQRLQTLGRVIGSKNSMPILDNFLFQVVGNQLTITASDSEITLHTALTLNESEGEMDFTVNAKTLQDAVKEISDQPIDFFVNTDTLEITIKYQNGQYVLAGQSAAEYPFWKELDGEVSTLNIDAQRIHDAMGRALFAAGDDPLRPVMNGVFFDYKEDGLALVASDGRKLACSRLLDLKADVATSFILHKRPAHLLRLILQKEEGEVQIQFNKRNACISSTSYKMSCRLIEGNFPNYNGVIPRDNPHKILVNRASLIAALRRVQILANAGSPLVKLTVDTGRVILTTRDIDYGRSGEETVLCEYSSVPMSIGFKGPLLMELLNNLDCEEVELQLADPSRAGVIVPTTQPENEHILMLLMPMMLND